MTASNKGTLYIVATPIGNLGDFSERAVETLRRVAVIAAEDTRHSRTLLQHCQISTRLLAYHDHSDERATAELIALLEGGESVALISDAGTPLISDPGYELVRSCRTARIPVLPIPGASAVIAALSVAGLACNRFAFEGFLPAKSAARRRHLESLLHESRTVVFYESPHRIAGCLGDLQAVLGDERLVFIARELTKKFETHFFGSVAAARHWLEQDPDQCRGEFVVVLAGAPVQSEAEEELGRALGLVEQLASDLPLKRAVAIASEFTGVRKNPLYQAALARRTAPQIEPE